VNYKARCVGGNVEVEYSQQIHGLRGTGMTTDHLFYPTIPKSEWKVQLRIIYLDCNEAGIEVARSGIANIVYPKIFDYGVQEFQ